MREYLPFLVIGLASGSIYAIAAMGLVVTYKTSGVFNFAHGAVGMIATFIFYSLRVDVGVPTWLAAALAILVVAPLIGVVIDRVLLRRLRGASASSYVVVSLGLLVGLQYLAMVICGPAARSVEPIFSRGTFRLPGVNVGYDQAIIVAISLASALALAAFFRATRLGIQTRAVVDDADLTELMGTSSARVTTFSWMLGCSFATLAGVLLSPFLGIDAILLTLLVIKAFGAAAVGRLVSLPRTYLGAIGIGVGEALLTKWVAARPSLAGLPRAGAGGGAGRHPGHPPVGAVPGPGHVRVRGAGPVPAVRHPAGLRRPGPADADAPGIVRYLLPRRQGLLLLRAQRGGGRG